MVSIAKSLVCGMFNVTIFLYFSALFFFITLLFGIFKMSTINLHTVEEIFKAIMKYRGFTEESELAEHLGVPYKTLMNWKYRNKIARYKPFVDRGYSEDWMRTGRGFLMKEITGTSASQISVSSSGQGTADFDQAAWERCFAMASKVTPPPEGGIVKLAKEIYEAEREYRLGEKKIEGEIQPRPKQAENGNGA